MKRRCSKEVLKTLTKNKRDVDRGDESIPRISALAWHPTNPHLLLTGGTRSDHYDDDDDDDDDIDKIAFIVVWQLDDSSSSSSSTSTSPHEAKVQSAEEGKNGKEWIAVKIIDTELGSYDSWFRYLVWKPDGTQVAISGFDASNVLVYSFPQWEMVFKLPRYKSVRRIEWSPDGECILIQNRSDDHTFIWNARSGEATLQIDDAYFFLGCVGEQDLIGYHIAGWKPNSRTVVGIHGFNDTKMASMDVPPSATTRTSARKNAIPVAKVTSICSLRQKDHFGLDDVMQFHPTGNWIVFGGSHGAMLFDVRKGKILQIFRFGREVKGFAWGKRSPVLYILGDSKIYEYPLMNTGEDSGNKKDGGCSVM